MKRLYFSILAALAVCAAWAQVTTSPATLTKDALSDTIVITFDPAAGNAGMKNATKCYCHTGLITSASKDDSDWKNVIGSWRGATQPQLTATADGKWQLTISNVYAFYGVPATTDIIKLAFVFHDGPGGSKEGKATGGGDIFIKIDGVDSEVGIWRGFTANPCVEQARPAGVEQGIYYGQDGTSVTLCTYAASKSAPANHVFLLGDMTGWKLDNQYQLKRDGNYFWITLTGLQAGKEYRFQYAVERADGKRVQLSELYSEKLLHPDDKYEPKAVNPSLISYPTSAADGGYVSVIQPGKPAYQWSAASAAFQKPDKNNLVIYELWVYDYTKERSFKGLMKRLDYIKNLGVNAIELMPICEFDGNYNWGYSPNHYFAVDKAYGSSEDFKLLVDSCHAKGMAVIMDMVFNHATGNNPMNKLYPYGSDLSQNPWFNVSAPHGDNVYEDWNHGFGPAHEMFVRALDYWQTEYHVDGFRMDLSHGFCSDRANTSVDNIIDYYNRAIRPHNGYFILEHWGSNMSTERPQLVNAGCLCWTNATNAYCQTAMGWLKDGDDFQDASKDGYVSYCESHDEERMQYKAKMYGNGDLQTNESARLARVAENVAFNVLLNGSHMLWQYEEIGYDFSINSSLEQPNGTSGDNRCSKKPRPEDKGYFTQADRVAQYQKVAQICHLRTHLLPQVFAGNPTATSIRGGQAVRTIQWGSDVFVAANFDAINRQIVSLPSSGSWFNYLQDATAPKAGGATLTLEPGELLIFTGTRLPLPTVSLVIPGVTPVEEIVCEVPMPTEARKIWRNNTIVIERAGRTYDLLGREL